MADLNGRICPDAATMASLGCGNPTAVAELNGPRAPQPSCRRPVG